MINYPEFVLNTVSELPAEGKVICSSPSNIALVKYWGKRPVQLPENASISFTLDACKTTTALYYSRLDQPSSDFDFELLFEGKPKEEFKPKIQSFLKE